MLHRAFLENRSVQNDWTLLFEACKSENIAAVECLLKNHANPNVRNRNGQTPLHVICSSTSKRALQIIQLLLEHNADIEAVNIRGETPLFRACVPGNIAVVKCLLENHANPNVPDRKGETSLHCIGFYHSTTTRQIIQLLLKHEAEIDAVDENGWTPLFKACKSGNVAAVECLLENHANPNVRNRNGQTPLHLICSSKSKTTLQIIQLLLEHNADIKAVNIEGETPLFKACKSGNVAAVECLLENHANPNVRNRNGQTPLHLICSSKSKTTLQIIQLLLEHNADIEAVNIEGATPLFRACSSENIIAVKCLLDNHANPNATDEHTFTVLHYICSLNSKKAPQIIRLLLKHNADVNAVTDMGVPPLAGACLFGSIAAVKYLLENHANPNVADCKGETPLHRIGFFQSRKTRQIIQLLLKHNADIEAVNIEGETPLIKACKFGDIEAAKCLLGNHANPHATDEHAFGVLHYICLSNSKKAPQIIRLLLKHNADVNAVTDMGISPLTGACVSGNIAAVKYLLENHANPNVANRKGETPLHHIGFYPYRTTRQIIQLLLKHNADIEAVDENGWTPLIKACKSGNIEAVKCFLENHANPNVANRNGETPLHHICLRECKTTLQIIQLLLNHNLNMEAVLENHAELNVADWNSETLFHHKCLKECGTTLQTIQLLLKHNANIEAVDEEGRTPLFEACNSENIVAVDGLLRYGANINILDKKNQSSLQCAVDKMLSTSFLYTHIYMIIQMLVSQIIKLKTAGLNVNAYAFVTMNGVKYSAIEGLKSNGVLDDTLDTLDIKCEEEIERMKMERIGINNMFFYDLLTQHIHLIGILMENEQIQKILKPSIYDEKFPLYVGIIRFRLRDAQIRYRRFKLKKSAREYFSLNINQGLPHECIDKVLDYLTIVDLNTFIQTFEPSRGK